MRKTLYIFFLICSLLEVSAQKLVIGSDVPTFKSFRDEISWTHGEPEDGNLPKLIDFYQSTNPTCVANLERLSSIAVSQKGVLEVVILTRKMDEQLSKLSGKIYVGVDTTGNGFFEKCNVKYLPYTMLVDGKNKLLWHGILNRLSDEMLKEEL